MSGGLQKQGEGQLPNPGSSVQRNSKSCLPSIGGARSSEGGSGQLAAAERRLNMSTEQAFGGTAGGLASKAMLLDQTATSNDPEQLWNAPKAKTPGMNRKGGCPE